MNQRPITEIEEHEMTQFESKLAQAILGALEYRGFYDCGKYLDASLIEHIRPLLETERRQADERLRDVLKEIVDTFDESDNEVARNVVLFYAKQHNIDITPKQ